MKTSAFPRRRSLPWVIALTVAFVAGLLTLAPTMAGAAGRGATQAPPPTPLTVTLNTLSPTIPKLKSSLALTGTVTNNTENTLTGISVNLRVANSAVTDRASVARIANQSLDPGWRGVYLGQVTLTTPLEPAASIPWSMKLPIANLQLINSGVYPLQVDATLDQDGSVTGLTRTFLPWFPTKGQVKPTKVVWLWPISDWPNRDANQVLLNDRTPIELAPGGRLRRLLDLGLAAKTQPQWVIDPQLLETADAMTGGYRVLSPSGEAVAGLGREEAAEWLTRARTGLKTSSVYAMAYADPDVTAMTRAGLTQDVILANTKATETVGDLLRRPVPVGLGWPAGNRTDQDSLNVLQNAGVRTVVLDTAAYPPVDGQPTVGTTSASVIRTESGPLTAALTDRQLSNSFGSSASSRAEATAARQRFLADTGVMAATSPDKSTTVAVGPDVRWDPNPSVVSELLATMQTAPWVRQTSLNSLLAGSSTDPNRVLAPLGRAARRAQLSTKHLNEVRAVQRRLNNFSSIIVEPGTITQPFRTALLRTESAAWRSEPAAGSQLLARVSAELEAQVNNVRVLSSGTITFPSNTGKVPITIANDLARPVQVGIELTANPSVRLVSKPVTKLTIPANRKISTEIPAQVVGAGELPVQVRLTTPTGQKYGKPSEIVLRSTAYARAASWVVGIAFAILLLLLLMNSIRRRRTRRQSEPPATTASVGDNSGRDADG